MFDKCVFFRMVDHVYISTLFTTNTSGKIATWVAATVPQTLCPAPRYVHKLHEALDEVADVAERPRLRAVAVAPPRNPADATRQRDRFTAHPKERRATRHFRGDDSTHFRDILYRLTTTNQMPMRDIWDFDSKAIPRSHVLHRESGNSSSYKWSLKTRLPAKESFKLTCLQSSSKSRACKRDLNFE